MWHKNLFQETRLMFVTKEVLLNLCELYPKSATAVKEMAIEKS